MSNMDNSNEVDTNCFLSTVEPLAKSTLEIYEPSLKHVQVQLKELTEKGKVLLQQTHNENLSLCEIKHDNDLHQLFENIEIYQAKLVNIRKDMRLLHEKSVKLKKRALKLQQFKERQEYIKRQQDSGESSPKH